MSCFIYSENSSDGAVVVMRPISDDGICEIGMLKMFYPEKDPDILKKHYAIEDEVDMLFRHLNSHGCARSILPQLSEMAWIDSTIDMPFIPRFYKKTPVLLSDILHMFDKFLPCRYIAIYYSQHIGWVFYDISLSSLWWPRGAMHNAQDFVEDFNRFILGTQKSFSVPNTGKYDYHLLQNLDEREFRKVLGNIAGTGVRVVQCVPGKPFGGVDLLLEFPFEYSKWLSL